MNEIMGEMFFARIAGENHIDATTATPRLAIAAASLTFNRNL